MKRLFAPFLLLALALAASPGAGAQSGPVIIGTLMSLTGDLAPYGVPIQNATILAVEDINAQGGVLGGRLLVAAHRDDGTSQQMGVDAANKLVNIDGVAAIVGALSSGVTTAVAESVAIPSGVVMVSPASTAPGLSTLADNGFVFRTVLSDAMQGVVLGELAMELGFKQVSVIYVNNPYGQGLYERFKEAYEASGGRILGAAPYDSGKSSYRGELQAVTRNGTPDALVVVGYVSEGGTLIVRQALEGGFAQRFLLPDGMKSLDVIRDIGAGILEGTHGTAPSTSETSTGFIDRYQQKFGTPPPQPYMAEAYDAVFLVAMAIEKAGSTDRTAIRDALSSLLDPNGVEVVAGDWKAAQEAIASGQKIKYLGASGSFHFDAAGDRTSGTVEVWKITGGNIVSVRNVLFE